MNVKIVLALVLLGVAAAFGFTSFKRSMTPYISFREARQTPGMVQVNGVLANKNYVARRDEQFLQFDLKDSHGETMKVEYRGGIPGNFAQATSIVAVGRAAVLVLFAPPVPLPVRGLVFVGGHAGALRLRRVLGRPGRHVPVVGTADLHAGAVPHALQTPAHHARHVLPEPADRAAGVRHRDARAVPAIPARPD